VRVHAADGAPVEQRLGDEPEEAERDPGHREGEGDQEGGADRGVRAQQDDGEHRQRDQAQPQQQRQQVAQRAALAAHHRQAVDDQGRRQDRQPGAEEKDQDQADPADDVGPAEHQRQQLADERGARVRRRHQQEPVAQPPRVVPHRSGEQHGPQQGPCGRPAHRPPFRAAHGARLGRDRDVRR
jgi:hypothetical protein